MFVSVYSPAGDLFGYVKTGTDLDGIFELRCEETGEAFKVNGPVCDIEEEPPAPFSMAESEIIATIYMASLHRERMAGALGFVERLAGGAARVTTDQSVVVVRPTAKGWSVTSGLFEAIDADLEVAAAMALSAAGQSRH